MDDWIHLGAGAAPAAAPAPAASAGGEAAASGQGNDEREALSRDGRQLQPADPGAPGAADPPATATPPPAATASPDAPAAAAGGGGQPDEATVQLGIGARLHDGRSPHPVHGPAAMRASPAPTSDHGSSQATPTRPGRGESNDVDVWRFVQATDIIGSADVPEGLRVDKFHKK